MAIDSFYDINGTFLRQRKGGPAFYIRQALEDLAVTYDLKIAKTMKVDITVNGKDESGFIKSRPVQKKIYTDLRQDVIIVSTILNEWELVPSTALLFVDIQGYARFYRQQKIQRKIKFTTRILDSIAAIKATSEEACQMEIQTLEKMKRKQLIITRGSGNITVWAESRAYEIPVQPVYDLPDSVGAGDTWFSAYVSYVIVNNFFPVNAANAATLYTRNFLERKKIYEGK